jgi:hypothetical protein
MSFSSGISVFKVYKESKFFIEGDFEGDLETSCILGGQL